MMTINGRRILVGQELTPRLRWAVLGRNSLGIYTVKQVQILPPSTKYQL